MTMSYRQALMLVGVIENRKTENGKLLPAGSRAPYQAAIESMVSVAIRK